MARHGGWDRVGSGGWDGRYARDVGHIGGMEHAQLEREGVVVPRAASDVVLVVADVVAATAPSGGTQRGLLLGVDERLQAEVEERVWLDHV